MFSLWFCYNISCQSSCKESCRIYRWESSQNIWEKQYVNKIRQPLTIFYLIYLNLFNLMLLRQTYLIRSFQKNYWFETFLAWVKWTHILQEVATQNHRYNLGHFEIARNTRNRERTAGAFARFTAKTDKFNGSVNYEAFWYHHTLHTTVSWY